MTNNAIEVENLSKRYRIGFEKQGQDTFAEVLSDWIIRPIRNYRKLRSLTELIEMRKKRPKRGYHLGITGCII